MTPSPDDHIRRLLEALEQRLERIIHRDIQKVDQKLDRIEKEVVETRNRVTAIEQKSTVAEARAAARAETLKETADEVAAKLEGKERSRKWWLGAIAAAAAGIGAIATAASLLATYLH